MAYRGGLRRAGIVACSALLGGTLLFGGAAVAPIDQNVQSGGAQSPVPAVVVPAYARSAKVYIAPYSGTKFHRSKSCRGLRHARSIKKISVKTAKRQHYTKCKLCWR